MRYAVRGTVGIVVCLLICSCMELPGESQTRHYPTRADAERDGAFVRGWLPADLPAQASDIMESHNLDSNQMWVRFQLGGTAPDRLLRRCVVDTNVPLPPARQSRRIAPWWPEALMEGGAYRPTSGVAYRCSAPGISCSAAAFGMLVDEGTQQVWYWSIPVGSSE